MLKRSGIPSGQDLDGFACLRDEDYERMLEQLRALLLHDRDAVLLYCRRAHDDGSLAESQGRDLSALRNLLAEQTLLLKDVERESACIHWDSGSLFRRLLSPEEKRTVCRILALLEELEGSLKRLLGELHHMVQALQAERKKADKMLAFLRAVLSVASEDAELVALCAPAFSKWERLCAQRNALLVRVTEGGEALTPLVRQQLPYACTQIVRFAGLEEAEGDGNARELLAILSALSDAATAALSRCGECLLFQKT